MRATPPSSTCSTFRQVHRNLPAARSRSSNTTWTPGNRRAARTAELRKVKRGEPGLLLSKVSSFQPFDGYTDKSASEKKLVRDAFKDGDVWFNTGDLMRSQGFGHAAFADRLGDTFRWKGENVATTEVEAGLSGDAQVEEATVFGVEVPGAGGRAGHGGAATEVGRGVRRQAALGAGGLRRICRPMRCALFVR